MFPPSRADSCDPLRIHIFQPPTDNARTGGYLYNRRIAEEIPSAEVHETTPAELPPALAAARGAGARLLVDSLFIGATNPDVLREHRAIALVHHLPSLDPGFSDRSRAEQAGRESAFLAACTGAVVTSEFMRSLLSARAEPGRVACCPPGVDDAFFAVSRRVPGRSDPVEVITVANLEPRKGYLEIVEALAAEIPGVPWRWHIVGADTDRAYAAAVRAAIADAALDASVTTHGSVEPAQICALLARVDAHLFPTRFESYGMAVAESVAAGVPVVAPRLGEIPRLVRDGETGLLAPAGAPRALAAALGRLLGDPDLRGRLRRSCEAHRRSVPRWRDAAGRFAEAVAPLA